MYKRVCKRAMTLERNMLDMAAQPSGYKGAGLAHALGWFSIGLGLAEMLAPKEMTNLIGMEDTEANHHLLRAYGLREFIVGAGILSHARPTGWVWGRVAGDAMDLATLATATNAPNADKGKLAGAAAAVIGITALDVLAGMELNKQE